MSGSADAQVEELRKLVALSCRILARTGCVREITGHVSARIPGTDEFVVRCRPPQDPGVEFTVSDDVKRVNLETTNDDLEGGYILPGEWPIHSEIYRARPGTSSVVHGHPRSSLICGILALPLRPVVGAYDPGMLELTVRGVPVFDNSVLISTADLGQQVVATLGDTDACMLRGHGVVAVGASVQEATVRAIKLEAPADLTLGLRSVPGARPIELDEHEIKEVGGFVNNQHGSRVYAEWTFDHYRLALGDRADVLRRT